MSKYLVIPLIGLVCCFPGFVLGKTRNKNVRPTDAVKIIAKSTDVHNDLQTITLKLRIDKGWFVYANPSGPEGFPAIPTTVGASEKDRIKIIKIDYPAGKKEHDKVLGTWSRYEKTALIRVKLERNPKDTQAIKLAVKFQPMTRTICAAPVVKVITVR
jgi:hypothetical protein